MLRYVVADTCYIFNNIKSVNVKHFNTISLSEFDTVNKGKQWNDIPGPSSLPVIGQLLHYTPKIGSLNIKSELERQTYLYNNYGPVVKLEGLRNQKSLYVFDPEDFKQVYKNEFSRPFRDALGPLSYYCKTQKKTDDVERVSTLITENDVNWRLIRTAANPVMLKSDVVKTYQNVLDDIANEMISRIKKVRNEENILKNNLPEFALWAIESTSATSLGGRIHGLDSGEGTLQRRLIQIIDEVFKLCEALDYDPKFGLWRMVNTPSLRKCMKLFKEHEELVTYFIDKSSGNHTEMQNSTGCPKTVFRKMSEAERNFAVNIATDALTAGIFTTATAMQLILYNLSQNPNKQDKLRKSLENNDSKYLKACIKESMRIKPAVSRVKRTTTKDQIIGGYLIPCGTTLTMGHHHASMQEQNFPNPTEYIPERWIVDKDDPLYYGNAHPYAYMPFGFGLRSCIGQRLAELNLETLLTKLVQNFNISWSNPDPTLTIVTKVNNVITDPDHFKFEDINTKN